MTRNLSNTELRGLLLGRAFSAGKKLAGIAGDEEALRRGRMEGMP